MKVVKIGRHYIADNYPPFVIAELSGNHQQSLQLAKQMVAKAADAGAHAIKLQSYTADSMTLDVDKADFRIQEPDSLWHGEHLHQLYQKAATPYEWHRELFDFADSLGLIAFSSPFDKDAVDMLAELNVPCYKIASFENTDLPLIEYVAKQGKPVIISTGMASLGEIDEAVGCVRGQGNDQIVLLKCTSTYPASPSETNLLTLPHLRDSFSCQVGLSDHTTGIGIGIASVALGARVIEKHFVLNRNDGGVDAAFSLEPHELSQLVDGTKDVFNALGKVHYGITESEQKACRYRRSIYIAKDMKAGERFSEQNLRIVRPGFGLAPKYIRRVLGKKIRVDVDAGTPLQWELID